MLENDPSRAAANKITTHTGSSLTLRSDSSPAGSTFPDSHHQSLPLAKKKKKKGFRLWGNQKETGNGILISKHVGQLRSTQAPQVQAG